MSIENVSSTPNAPELNTENVEDFGQRLYMVEEAARAEQKTSHKKEAEAEEATGDAPAQEAETTEEAPDTAADAKEEAPPPAATEASKKEPTAEEKARKAALANAARLERESVRRSTELAAKAAELKAKEAAFSDREAKLTAFEKAYNDPDALLELLAEKVTPEKMSQFFIEAGDPAKVAERRAKAALQSATEPVNFEVAKLREEMKALKEKAEEAEAKIQRATAEKEFASRVMEVKASAPHAARLLAKRPADFYRMADTSAARLMAAAEAEGRNASWDDVIKDIDTHLETLTRDLQDEAAAAAPSTPEKTNKPAAAKAPTVSNRAASERSEIVNPDDNWGALPFEERVRRAEKRARTTG